MAKFEKQVIPGFWEHFARIKEGISIVIADFSAFYGISLIEYLENRFVNSDIEPWYIVLKLLLKLCGTFNISFPETVLAISGPCTQAFVILVISEFEVLNDFSVSISGVY